MATLIVLQGSDKGKTFKTADELVILGRGGDEVPLTDRTISRRHAELTPHDGAWHIRDLNSANGERACPMLAPCSPRTLCIR